MNNWINAVDFSSEEKVESVTGIYNQLNVRLHAENEMETHAEKAFVALEQINLPAEQKQYLRYFADGLLVREN